MSKHVIQIEVDGSKLFDAVAKVGGDEAPHLVGFRLLGVMMTGELNLVDAIGLAVYGIDVRSIQRVPPEHVVGEGE